MALADKNIVITPNVGQSADPQIVFSGADASTSAQNITVKVYPTENGTLSFEGSSGQLFSITNSLSGTIFSVNDISGIPSIEVLDTGVVKLAEYSGNILIGTNTDNGTDKVQISGNADVTGSLSVNIFKQKQVALTTTATTNIDFSTSGNFYITMSQNTAFTFSNISANIGSSGYILLKQNGTGGFTFTLPAEAKTSKSKTISQWTVANSLSLITYYIVDASTIIVNYIGDFGTPA